MANASTDPDALIAWFGYGSLVCRQTHRTGIVAAYPARLSGWRRHWRPRADMPGFPAALLSVREQPGAGCDGLLVIDRAENLAALDVREARYDRIEIERSAVSMAAELPESCPIYLYVAQTHLPVHRDPPLILQSYLDAVMAGFHEEHGEAGLRRFIEETEGFGIGLHLDRAAPVYPRHVPLAGEAAALFDRLLAAR